MPHSLAANDGEEAVFRPFNSNDQSDQCYSLITKATNPQPGQGS